MTQGQPTVLVPGTLCDAALWDGVAAPPGTRAVPRVRGASLADAAARVLEAAPSGAAFHLVGFSLGAIVAFEVLRLAPKRVARLTLIGANPRAPTSAQLDLWNEHERQVRAGHFEEVIEVFAAGPHRHAVLNMARRVGPDVYLEQLGLLRSRPDSRPDLARYNGPLKMLVGLEDAVTPPHLADELRMLAPRAEVFKVSGAGHYLPLDAPQVVSDVLGAVAYA